MMTMKLAVDLHTHSPFAGGTKFLDKSKESLKKATEELYNFNNTMPLKGIDVVGTGDCQFIPWYSILKENLIENDKVGLYELNNSENIKFILQTELIFTLKIGKRSKLTHIILLFPDFNSIDELNKNLGKWEVKTENMARPFIKNTDVEQLSNRLFTISEINKNIEIIPAHIMTPQGVFGSSTRINQLKEFFGNFSEKINTIETGLSADPLLLEKIPELSKITFISNSDAHSAQLHRLGREFTVLNMSTEMNYNNIISSLRKNQVDFTAEFPPEEGRYFLTGHRENRKSPGKHEKDEYCYFSPKNVPEGDICPICNKSLTVGVLQRIVEIEKAQKEIGLTTNTKKRKYLHMVPLIEIIGSTLGVKTKTAKSILKEYHKIIEIMGSEIEVWQSNEDKIKEQLGSKIKEDLIKNILQVKKGKFTFKPIGFDGQYGNLIIGEPPADCWNIKYVNKK